MAISLTSPVTGTAQTGLTTPTYTLASDTVPGNEAGKQWIVTALGGTQTGVTVHSASSPFSIMFARPATLAVLGTPNPATGVISNIRRNKYRTVIRKGVNVAAGQPTQMMYVRMEIEIPAGADVYDASSVRAALSLAIGSLSQQSAGLGDTVIQGSI